MISPLSDFTPNYGEDNSPNLTDEQLSILRSQWLPHILEKNPDILALCERVIPWTGGYSFANIKNSAKTVSQNTVNRFVILQLIYQHLQAIGMNRTADILMDETRLQFQCIEQPWQKTHLMTLLSLGVLSGEDPWNIPIDVNDQNIQYVEELYEEDFFASPYKEDPKLIFQEMINPTLNITYNCEPYTFQHLQSCSLKRLVVLLITSPLDFMNEEDLNGIFLTLHSITTSEHFLELLTTIFDHKPSNFQNAAVSNVSNLTNSSSLSDIPIYEKLESTLTEVKVSIINLIKKWVLFHGLFIGHKTLKLIESFIQKAVDSNSEDIINCRVFLISLLKTIPHLTYGMKCGDIPKPTELPIIKDPQIIFKPTLTFIDPDPLEVARQITLLSHASFKKIHSREFAQALIDKKISLQTPTLTEFFQFSSQFCQMVLETVILSQDKQATFARVIEISNGLLSLCNFHILADLLAQLLRNEVLNIVNASQTQIDSLVSLQMKCGGETPNLLKEYSTCIQERFESWKPAIPNLKAEFPSTNVSKMPDFVNGLINIEKRRKIAQKVVVYYRFQNKQYSYLSVKQIQKVVLKGPSFSNEILNQKIENIWRYKNKLSL